MVLSSHTSDSKMSELEAGIALLGHTLRIRIDDGRLVEGQLQVL